ncbi:hypothetical protein BDR07DRAFT_1481845 [Suillus spraguei]|nr:hypothetical protein BDR07DRAFT_1481845 [Suillus spraguei]
MAIYRCMDHAHEPLSIGHWAGFGAAHNEWSQLNGHGVFILLSTLRRHVTVTLNSGADNTFDTTPGLPIVLYLNTSIRTCPKYPANTIYLPGYLNYSHDFISPSLSTSSSPMLSLLFSSPLPSLFPQFSCHRHHRPYSVLPASAQAHQHRPCPRSALPASAQAHQHHPRPQAHSALPASASAQAHQCHPRPYSALPASAQAQAHQCHPCPYSVLPTSASAQTHQHNPPPPLLLAYHQCQLANAFFLILSFLPLSNINVGLSNTVLLLVLSSLPLLNVNFGLAKAVLLILISLPLLNLNVEHTNAVLLLVLSSLPLLNANVNLSFNVNTRLLLSVPININIRPLLHTAPTVLLLF